MLIAIDPGANGGIAIRYDDGGVSCFKMPDTPKDICDLFNPPFDKSGIYAVMEKVGQHVQGNNASASCKFARHCGHIEMALIAAGIPFREVTPQKWMKAMGALPKEKTARKNKIKDQMQRRFPDIKVTLGNADALGILTWAEESK